MKMTNKQILLNAFAIGIKPEQNSDIVQWCKDHVRLATSSRSEYMDLTMTPWLINPLKEILGNKNSDICIVAPIGSGKTSIMTAAITYIVAEKPGPTLVGMLTNPDAQEMMETVIVPSLKGCKSITKLWPTKRTLIRKDQILFAHMPLWVSGSNITNFTSKSCDYVMLDEAWQLKKSLMKDAQRRTHDRFNSKFVLLSQAGIVGDDFHNANEQCYKYEFCYRCPNCGEFHSYKFDDVIYTSEKTELDEVIWDTLKVWLECPTCKHVINDNVNERRALSESGKYILAESNNPLAEHISFHYNAFAVWWVSWTKIITEFIKANKLRRAGDYDPIRQFFQQRMARPFNESDLLLENSELITSSYTLEEAKSLRYDEIIMTADVQMDVLFYVIRTWKKNGESKLLSYGVVNSFEELYNVQTRWEIKHNRVGIDSAYRPQEVKEAILQYRWVGLNGRKEKDYLINDRKTKQKYRRIYSDPVGFKIQGKIVTITHYSSNSTKDILFRLKQNLGVKWEIPSDTSEDYKNQLNSEVKVFDDGKYFYKQISNRNHYLDTEAEQIIMALGHNCFPSKSMPTVEIEQN